MTQTNFVRHHRSQPDGLPRGQACDFVAIDFETANALRGSACAVGATLVRRSQVVAQGATLINPELDFTPYCTNIHGIGPEDVQSAPTMADIWPALTELLDGQAVVAHNASFDLSVLRNSAARYDVSSGPSFDFFCTYRMARAAWPDFPSHSLRYVAPALGIPLDHHEAGSDAHACALVALRLVMEHAGLQAAAEAMGMVPGHATPDSYRSFRLPGSNGASSHQGSLAGNIDADPDHPLYGKSICFTGTLQSMVRNVAHERVAAVGCDFKTTVSKNLDYLVIGDGDFVQFADGPRTGKVKKALALREEGATIEIVPEQDFLALLLS